MTIEKYISTEWRIARTFEEPMKLASGFSPETYIPPEICEFAQNVESNPKFCYAHVIAMTDAGHYGANMNGDRFRADELTGLQTAAEAAKNRGKFANVQVPRFKTFETAKFYRNHANSPMDDHYGDVPLAVWNDQMKRAELVIRIYRDASGMGPGAKTAADIAQRIDNGGHITVSMGCRIHHEKCEYCGHENELTRDRCDHLKYAMGRMMPDGRQVAADNFGPNFFDISDVGIPADPVAYSLGKVASAGAICVPNRAKDVEELFNSMAKSAWRLKWAEIEKQVPGESTVGDMPVVGAEGETTSIAPAELGHDDLSAMLNKGDGDINTVISTLAACGIVLSPTELAQLTALATPPESDDINAPTDLSLDKFSHAIYTSCKEAITQRSGFNAPRLETGWEPEKIAAVGGSAVEMAAFYAYYRTLLSSLPVSQFTKEASRNSAVREIQGGTTDYNRVKAALYHLAYAGLATA